MSKPENRPAQPSPRGPVSLRTFEPVLGSLTELDPAVTGKNPHAMLIPSILSIREEPAGCLVTYERRAPDREEQGEVLIPWANIRELVRVRVRRG